MTIPQTPEEERKRKNFEVTILKKKTMQNCLGFLVKFDKDCADILAKKYFGF